MFYEMIVVSPKSVSQNVGLFVKNHEEEKEAY